MKFLKNLFHFDSDATAMEKLVTVLVPIIFFGLFLWLVLASYGVGNSALAHAHELARPNAAVWATFFFIAAAVAAWAIHSDRVPFRVNDTVAILVVIILLILAVNANAAFFTYVY